MGHNLVNYPGDCGTPNANLIPVKPILNSIISTPHSKFLTVNLKDFYCMTQCWTVSSLLVSCKVGMLHRRMLWWPVHCTLQSDTGWTSLFPHIFCGGQCCHKRVAPLVTWQRSCTWQTDNGAECYTNGTFLCGQWCVVCKGSCVAAKRIQHPDWPFWMCWS